MAANIITHKGEILTGKKEERDDHLIGGMWHLLGGHIDHGETLEEGVRREVKEETGLDAEVRDIVDAMTFPQEDGDEENA
jgi:8-oxo-dGTP diphosphatase